MVLKHKKSVAGIHSNISLGAEKKKGSLLILLLYPTITEGEWNFKNPTPSPVGEALVLL